MTDRLKPCPFCGGKANFQGNGHWISCEDCLAETNYFDYKEEAIKAWNTRKPMDRIVEQLEEEQGKIYKDGVHVANEKSFIHIDDAIAIVQGVRNYD